MRGGGGNTRDNQMYYPVKKLEVEKQSQLQSRFIQVVIHLLLPWLYPLSNQEFQQNVNLVVIENLM